MEQKQRCVIIGAAEIQNYEKIKKYFRNDDYYIYCDAGLKHQEALGVWPNLIIGDFDSYSKAEMERKYQEIKNAHEDSLNQNQKQAQAAARKPPELIVLPCEKDDTDTVFAVKEAMRRNFAEFLLVGVIGQRLDHTLANVSILYMLDEAGKQGRILDDYSEMQLVSGSPVRIDDTCAYFSLLNVSGQAEGVTITHAKYPLQDAAIHCEYQYGVSNEVLPGETAEVTVARGKLLLIKILPSAARR